MTEDLSIKASAASMGSRRCDLIAAILILIAVLLTGAPGITEGGLGWSDAPNHTFDGVFVYEFFRNWPLDHAREWAEQFYLRYPALGIIVYYPPGFAVVEAGLFAIFGVNIAVARATVLVFAFGAGWLMYLLGRRWFDRPTGLLASLLLITCPHGLLWMNDVMLEWPATFWILASVWTYEQYRQAHRPIWAIALAAAIVMAFMTKQTAGFILPVLLVQSLLQPDRRKHLLRPSLIASIIVACAIIGAYILFSRKYTALPSQLLRVSFDLTGLAHWPAEILGWPLVPIALLGLLTFIMKPDRGPRALLLLWFAAWTGFSLSIAAKEPRYLFFSIPPLAFAAVRFGFVSESSEGSKNTLSWSSAAPRLALLSTLVFVQGVLARSHDTGRLPDHAAAVAKLVDLGNADLVLIDAVRDGQFIFDVYQNAAARDKIIPLRASKLLYARAAREKYDYQQFVDSPEEIVALFNRYGIRYAVIESEYPTTPYADADPPPRKMLRELLAHDARFALVESWPMKCGDPIWDSVKLQLYEYRDCPPRTHKKIKLSIPAMNREVELELP